MRSNDGLIVYYSGMQSGIKVLMKALEAGLEVGGVCFAYPGARDIPLTVYRKLSDEYGVGILMDSGAHGILFAASRMGLIKYTAGKNVNYGHGVAEWAKSIVQYRMYNNYFRSYVRWLKYVSKYMDFVVEVDIQQLVGQDKVWEWRKEMVKELGAGQVMLVWHGEDDDYISEMLQYSDVIGFGGTEGKIVDEKLVIYVGRLKEKFGDFWAHLFAYSPLRCQRYSGMQYVNSIDATSWNMYNRYGATAIFENGKIITLDVGKVNYNPDHKRLLLQRIKGDEFMKRLCQKFGIDIDKVNKLEGIPPALVHVFTIAELERWRKWYNKHGRKNIRIKTLW